MPTIPIVVISFDRLSVLQRAVSSYQQIANHHLIIHDTGSTYGPLLAYLEQLGHQGVTVFRDQPAINSREDLNSVDITVQKWLRRYPRTQYYCVTDPDIMLEPGCQDIFSFYGHMLRIQRTQVIGPMLRIDDIPVHYPLRDRVIAGHTAQYWSKEPSSISWKGIDVPFQHARIDTTFGMYPSSLPFQRYREGIRTYSPYWAKHLDWYIDPNKLADDQLLWLHSSSEVSHWGSRWLRKRIEDGIDPSLD